jgi:hypothetical protein
VENNEHYFLHCKLFVDQRYAMLNNIRDLGLDISINNILYGNLDFEYDVSCTLFAAVHRCIMDTKKIVYCLLTPNSSDGNDSTSIPMSLAVGMSFSSNNFERNNVMIL